MTVVVRVHARRCAARRFGVAWRRSYHGPTTALPRRGELGRASDGVERPRVRRAGRGRTCRPTPAARRRAASRASRRSARRSSSAASYWPTSLVPRAIDPHVGVERRRRASGQQPATPDSGSPLPSPTSMRRLASPSIVTSVNPRVGEHGLQRRRASLGDRVADHRHRRATSVGAAGSAPASGTPAPTAPARAAGVAGQRRAPSATRSTVRRARRPRRPQRAERARAATVDGRSRLVRSGTRRRFAAPCGDRHGRPCHGRQPTGVDADQASQLLDARARDGRGRRSMLVDVRVDERARRGRRSGRATIVCQAPTGPQRSHASTGSATAPANAGPVEPPHRHVADRAGRRARRARPSRPRHPAPPSVAISSAMRAVAGAGAVAQLGQQHRLAGLQPQRRAVGRRRPVDAEADVHAGGAQVDDRRDARRQDQVAARAVGHADAGRAEPDDLVGVRASRSAPPTCGRCTSRCARGTPSAGSRTWPARTRRPRRSRRSGCAGARRAARPARPMRTISSLGDA